LTETIHPGAFIVSESEGPYHTREAVRIALNQTIVPGTVLARNAVGTLVTSSAAAGAGNAGNGAITLDGSTPVLEGAKDGVYRAVCIAVAANGGTFEVSDPAGVTIGKVAVGATFATEVKFVIADGGTDFAAGDQFLITVGIEQTDYDYSALDLTKAGDFAKAAGLAVYGVTTDGTNKQKIAAIVRGPCEVRLSDLTFPAGITSAQKAEVIRQLEALGIVGR